MAESGWFTHFWNGTPFLGWQDQILWRLLKGRGSELNPFSDDFDPALIPFNYGASQEREVTGEDFGAEGFWERALVETALSPVSYLTGGATKAAKMAQSVGRASRIKGLSHAAIAGKTLRGSVDKMAESAAKLTGKEATEAAALLERARSFGEGLDEFDNLSVKEMGQLALDKELIFGLPFGLAQAGLGIRVPTAHKSWFALTSDVMSNNRIAKGVGMGYAWMAGRNIPYLGKSMGALLGGPLALAEGIKRGTQSRVAFELAEDMGGLSDVMETMHGRGQFIDDFRDRFGPSFAGFRERVAELSSKGELASEIFMRTIARGQTGLPSDLYQKTRRQLGLPQADLDIESLESLFDDALDAANADRAQLAKAVMDRRPRYSLDLEKRHRLAFSLGEKVARGYHRLFLGDSGFAALREHDNLQRRAAAETTREMEGVAELMQGMFIRVAKNTGRDVDETRHAFGITMEVAPSTDEAAYWRSSLRPLWEQSGDQLVRARELRKAGDKAGAEAIENEALANLDEVEGAFTGHMERWLFGRLGDAGAVLAREDGPLALLTKKGLAHAGVPTDLVSADDAKRAGEKLKEIARSRTVRSSDSPYAQLVRIREQALGYVRAAKKALTEEGELPFMPLGLMGELENALVRFSDSVMEPFFEAAKQGGKYGGLDDLWNALSDLRREQIHHAERAGVLGRSVPVGYLGRVFSRQETQRVKNILGALATDERVAEAIFRPRASHLRDADHITLPTLNRIVNDLRDFDFKEGGGTLAGKVLDDLAQVVPEVKQRFSGDPVSPLIANISAFREIAGVEKFVDDLGEHAMNSSEKLPFITGRVVGFVNAGRVGGGTEVGEISADVLKDGRVQSRLQGRLDGLPEKWVLVERPDGRQVPIPLSGSQNEMVLAVAGEGKTAGHAAGKMLASGNKMPRLGAGTSDIALDGLIGQHVIAGSADIVNGMADSLGKRFDYAPSDLRMMFDQIHGLQKASVTVVRPSFHLFNLLSAVPMMRMQGYSYSAIMGGFLDAFRMFQDVKKAGFSSSYARQLAFEGSQTGWIPKALRGANIVRSVRIGDRLGRTEMVYRLAGTSEELGVMDFIRGAKSSGLHNTHGVENLRGITRETKQLEHIRRSAEFLADAADRAESTGARVGLFGALGAAAERPGEVGSAVMQGLSRLGESSEIVARWAAMMAGVRMGMDPHSAGRSAVTALVDYADTTRDFKRYVKLMTSFGTFASKMIPQSFRAWGRDPAALAIAARGLYGAPFTSADRGRLDAHLGEYKVSLQRAAPQLDLISSGAFYADALLDWDGLKTTPEDIGEDPFPLSMPLETVQTMLFDQRPGRMARGFRQVLRGSYVTRWTLSSPNDPLAPKGTIFDVAMREFLGVSPAAEVIRKKWLAGQMEALKRDVVRRMTQDPEDADHWAKELRAITWNTRRLLR